MASSYVVLARKWRPRDFDTLVGQEHVTRALRNALASGRTAHAFLFTGIRGVGKTTIARLLAMCFNCDKGMTPSPCGQCPACQEVIAGTHPDVLEIDAASHTQVDKMREVLDTVRYAPAMARSKVYILDEAHMLSRNAFNALLKTLEEPPPHVVFIFATTEARKIPPTIVSRCQRYDLKRVAGPMLTDHLQRVLEQEGIPWESAGLAVVARAADGSVRDALSLLDQAIAFGDGSVRYESMRELLGLTDREQALDLLEALLAAQGTRVLEIAERLHAAGADPATVAEDLLGLLHRAARAKVLGGAAPPPEDPQEERLRRLTAPRSMEHIQMVYQVLLKGGREIKMAEQPAPSLEMALLRAAYLRPVPSLEQLLQRASSPQGTPPGGQSPAISSYSGGSPPPPPISAAPATGGENPPQPPEWRTAQNKILDLNQQDDKLLQVQQLTTWDQLVSLARRHVPGLALKLTQQVACLDLRSRPGGGLEALELQLKNDCFGPPAALKQRLEEFLEKAGVGPALVTVRPAAENRPLTLGEQEEMRRAEYLRELENEALSLPAAQALLERFDATLLRVEPLNRA
ncbi:MAG: DNA polymerase III subunit gamma/tau [Magnetococcales bacterium]|nr:DNA polymerase III subunit gamma/tau [Magnetococcales bacterium]